jgi:SAM-dependent methyltransferase
MLDFTHRSYEKELLDGDAIPYEDVILNMQELNTINTILGGHTITLAGFKKLIGNRKEISIVEIGCGGGDNIRVIENYSKKENINYQLWGIDINFDIATFALEQNKNLNILCSDYRKVIFEQKPDIIFSSLFCHHFTEVELIEQLCWMKENSSIGFFINDLHRHWLAYYSIKILTKLFSKSYLVKNDAPLSVARGFKKNEWRTIFKKAGIENYSIQWKWAFRHLIIFSHER